MDLNSPIINVKMRVKVFLDIEEEEIEKVNLVLRKNWKKRKRIEEFVCPQHLLCWLLSYVLLLVYSFRNTFMVSHYSMCFPNNKNILFPRITICYYAYALLNTKRLVS